MKCYLCEEEFTPTDMIATGMNFTAHQECMLREVAGGIGHHLDHDYWCVEQGDTDAGLTRRESALAVWRLFQASP